MASHPRRSESGGGSEGDADVSAEDWRQWGRPGACGRRWATHHAPCVDQTAPPAGRIPFHPEGATNVGVNAKTGQMHVRLKYVGFATGDFQKAVSPGPPPGGPPPPPPWAGGCQPSRLHTRSCDTRLAAAPPLACAGRLLRGRRDGLCAAAAQAGAAAPDAHLPGLAAPGAAVCRGQQPGQGPGHGAGRPHRVDAQPAAGAADAAVGGLGRAAHG